MADLPSSCRATDKKKKKVNHSQVDCTKSLEGGRGNPTR